MQDALSRALDMRANGKIEEAIDYLYGVLGDDFDNHEVMGVLASMLSETEQFDRAERLFKRALEQPDVPTFVRLNYATFLSHSGRYADAKPQYSNAAAHAVADLQALITASGANGPAVDAIEQLAIAECNLARTHLMLGDVAVAKALAEKWLVMESTWEAAVEVVWSCVERQGLDVDAEAARYHAAGRASPDMVAELVHAAHERADPELPFEALGIAAAACKYLRFDWTVAVEGFAEELDEIAQPALEQVHNGLASEAVANDLRVVRDRAGRDWGRQPPAVVAINEVLGSSQIVHASLGTEHDEDTAQTCCEMRVPTGLIADERGWVSCEACLEAIEDAVAWKAWVVAGEEPDQPDGPTSNSDGALDRYYDAIMLREKRVAIAAFWANKS